MTWDASKARIEDHGENQTHDAMRLRRARSEYLQFSPRSSSKRVPSCGVSCAILSESKRAGDVNPVIVSTAS